MQANRRKVLDFEISFRSKERKARDLEANRQTDRDFGRVIETKLIQEQLPDSMRILVTKIAFRGLFGANIGYPPWLALALGPLAYCRIGRAVRDLGA